MTVQAHARTVVGGCARTSARRNDFALVRYNAKGEPVYIDDATLRKERAETEAWVKANC